MLLPREGDKPQYEDEQIALHFPLKRRLLASLSCVLVTTVLLPRRGKRAGPKANVVRPSIRIPRGGSFLC